ncbi:alpha-galactosidase [Rhizobiales bacterium]|uniref:alpha-galactosidase n=1 Tax=Hongsoonwoonella zoysiae TaxID=2821844 RepID=UPI001560216B|nr:alpha-galactosidase [Hongsoonwoonella zoysiae]NRG16615.1 alpha-galactosidase [Hongsoonwoonella zoysiae]
MTGSQGTDIKGKIRTWRIDGGGVTLALAAEDDRLPHVIHFGKALPGDEDLAALALATARPVVHAGLDEAFPLSLFPETGQGLAGHPALLSHRADGTGFETQFRLDGINAEGDKLEISASDNTAGLRLGICVELDEKTGILVAKAAIENSLEIPRGVDRLSCPAIPISRDHDRVSTWHGRWCAEFQRELSPWPRGQRGHENRTGRTSHEAFPGILSLSSAAGLNHGEAIAAHLGWSGNWRMIAEETADGDRQIQAGILYLPGECVLEPGERLETPELFVAWSDEGENGIARKFQRFARERIVRHPKPDQPRPVHFNSWEAVYFRHNVDELKELAEKAASLGVERFVLDDGWFPNRNDDTAGLGDWTVDPDKYPDGLTPLIDHVRDLGMGFGLWVEPEMVNADSDLYRAHPDWVLEIEGHTRHEGRQQLALDIARPEVSDHLFSRLNNFLKQHPIEYLKWDMNRVLTAPARHGKPVAAKQVHALYELLSRVRKAHPTVEIESCASGGGRIDFGILRHTERFWLSDNNDAHDRWPMHREASLFFPPELFGFHIGPSPSHTSGRKLDMVFRAWSAAVGGHMGLELDVRALTGDEAETLKNAIRFHKDWRDVLHKGTTLNLAPADDEISGRIAISEDGAGFVASLVQDATISRKATAPVRLTGLDPKARYEIAFPDGFPINDRARRSSGSPLAHGESLTLSGAALMTSGIRLPLAWPDSIHVITGRRVP